MARRTKRPPTAGANHLEWLRLVEVSGPFLSLPVLKEALPQGLEADDRDVRAELKAAHSEWTEKAHDRAYHTQWIRFVLGRALELGPEVLVDGPGVPANLRVRVAVHHEDLRPDFAVLGFAESGERPTRLVVQVFDAGIDLERPVEDARWKASPVTRLVELLRGVPDGGPTLGLVTNGEQWILVSAPRKGTTTFVTWHASLWFEEKITLQALRTLLGARRVFGPVDETLERLIERSAEHQHDVTIQLGLQVREAIELLVRRIDELDRGSGRTLLEGVTEKQAYEAAVTVMMRLVFVFYLEEQADLYFPVAKSNFYQRHYALSPLGASLRAEADRLGPDVLERRTSAWCRLLATFRAIHGGVAHVDMRLPAYGGHLFDPDRFPFLEGRKPGQGWRTNAAAPLAIDDATVLFVLEALQVLRVRDGGANGAETRRLSFRELGVEQIGNVYESLLDHTAKRAADAVVSLKASKGEEPEIELRELEQLYDPIDTSKLVSFVKERTGRTEPSIARDLEYEIEDDPSRWLVACGNDSELYGRVKPVAGLVREDRRKQPVVYPKDSIYVTAGADRRSTGTHYTPPSLTEPVVRYALEPLVYVGPAEGKPESEWVLRSPREILALRVCDLACGSGAFLVQACRYLGERLVEAWDILEASNPGKLLVTPEGDLSVATLEERLIPADGVERRAIARRLIADRCLYGVDISPMATEMAKLSLWLVALQRNRPFNFVDHAIRCGDSLLGVTALSQVKRFSMRHGEQQEVFAAAALLQCIDHAALKRQELEMLRSDDQSQITTKARLHTESAEAVSSVRALADCLVALELQGLDGEEYDARRVQDAQHVQQLMRADDDTGAQALRSTSALALFSSKGLDGRSPFHWPIEFPEVFARGGFDALIGNPPFQGGTVASAVLGTAYMGFVKRVNKPWHGKADLVGAFVRQAKRLLIDERFFGLLATASICRGETAESALRPLVASGCCIYRARTPFPWPGSASVTAVCIWITTAPWKGAIFLDDRVVEAIGVDLDEVSSGGLMPKKLPSAFSSFLGVKLAPCNQPLPADIVDRLSPDLMAGLLPAIGGDELGGLPDPMLAPPAIEVSLLNDQQIAQCAKVIGGHISRDALKHAAPAKELRRQMQRHPLLLACNETTHRHLAFAVLPTAGLILKHKAVGIPAWRWGLFAVLQSVFHELWAWKFGIRRKEDLVYLPKRCGDTFPLPEPITAQASPSENHLDVIGQMYHAMRLELMRGSGDGLTALYNRMHDRSETGGAIARLRALHVDMDVAVAAAYGWPDLQLGHGFQSTKQGERFTVAESARGAILDRLLNLNQRRFRESTVEVAHGEEPAPQRLSHQRSQSAQPHLAFDRREDAEGLQHE